MSILNFLQYNNAVPVAISLVLLGSASAFAATSPESIYSEQETVLSVDNTYLVGKDLASYSPRTQIVTVTEDGENYYVEYQFYTIDVEDYVWKDVVKVITMKVSKSELGPYRDLGIYVTKQLGENIDREKQRLADTQEIERRSVSQKVVATAYGGLIGKMMDETTEVLPGYTPVVVAPQPVANVAAAAGSSGSPSSSSGGSPSGGGSSSQIGLQILGNNPARVPVGSSYVDLGAVLIDPQGTNVGIAVFQEGREVQVPSVDTSTTSVHAIEYRATDRSGSTIMVRRIVLVGDASDPGTAISQSGATQGQQSAPQETPAETPPQNEPEETPPPQSEPEDTVLEEEAAETTEETTPEPAPQTPEEQRGTATSTEP